MKIKIFNSTQLIEAAALLKDGEIVAFPTETVYGLGAPIFLPRSVEKIFQAKQRPADNPLIAHVASVEACSALARELDDSFYRLAEKFFPGPLTLVMHKKDEVPNIATGNLPTIALRMPNHPLALELIREVGQPLVAPSANVSGRPSSTTALHVVQDFAETIGAVVDGGECSYGMESTVIDLVNFEKPTLLRPGALSRAAIERVLGARLDIYTQGPKSSPGMKYRHYAPLAPVTIFSKRNAFEEYLNQNKRFLLLSTKPVSYPHFRLEAKTLYSYLRLADEKGYDEVVIFCPNGVDETLSNRLEKIKERPQALLLGKSV